MALAYCNGHLGDALCLQKKVAYRDRVPLLSKHGIVELLSYYLPTKKNSEQEIFRQIIRRHEARLKSIEHHYRKRATPSKINNVELD